MHKLRKAAQGRVTAWLGTIDPDEPPQNATPPPDTPPPEALATGPDAEGEKENRRGRTQVDLEPDIGVPSHKRSPAVSPARSAKSVRPEQPTSPIPLTSPAKDTLAPPNPRSSGFLPIGTVRAQPTGTTKPGQKPTALDAFLMSKASPRLGVYPPRPVDPEVRYDIRSARGGKGGIVTSVAALWAQGVSTAETGANKTPTPASKPATRTQVNAARLAEQWQARTRPDASKPTPKPKPEPVADGRPKMMRPVGKAAHSSPAVTSPTADPMSNSLGDLTARRARMVKAMPATAAVSSSTAVPTLSSTASLARPAPTRAAERAKINVRLPPSIAEAVGGRADSKSPASSSSKADTPKGPGSPPAKADYAFGQAKLRELIKRYQGQVNSPS